MKDKLIGFWNYSVILTYVGLMSSVYGMTEALEHHYKLAIACLAFSGVCDMLDGKIARTCKRTEDAKCFGIQIDSLCDLFCFGAFPAFLAYSLGLRGFWGTLIMCLYVLGGVVRLGYFNVMEMKRQQKTSEVRKYYQGLPITSIAIIFPAIYLVKPLVGSSVYIWVLGVAMLMIAILFVSNIKVYKPGNKMMAAIIALGLVMIAILFYRMQ